MAEQLSSFEGIELTAEDESIVTNIIAISGDPSINGGISAPVGSLALSTNGRVYYKNNTGNIDWITNLSQQSGEFSSLSTLKVSLNLNDRIILEDSEDTFNKKYTTLQNLANIISGTSNNGYFFSRRGNLNAVTVLLTEDGILSSQSGNPLSFLTPSVYSINASTRDLNTYNLRVFQHEGNSVNRINIATVSATNTRNLRAVSGVDFTPINTLTPGFQLGIELSSGNARDIVVEMIIQGTLS